jgi:hypothetical protein
LYLLLLHWSVSRVGKKSFLRLSFQKLLITLLYLEKTPCWSQCSYITSNTMRVMFLGQVMWLFHMFSLSF